jgi:hypothetical protein
VLELDLILTEPAREGREEKLLRSEVLVISLEVIVQVLFFLSRK